MSNQGDQFDRMVKIGEDNLANKKQVYRAITVGFLLVYLITGASFVLSDSWMEIVTRGLSVVTAMAITIYSLGNSIEFQRNRIWQLYTGTFVFLGWNHDSDTNDVTVWIRETLEPTDYYFTLNSDRMVVFKDRRMAAMAKLMVRRDV